MNSINLLELLDAHNELQFYEFCEMKNESSLWYSKEVYDQSLLHNFNILHASQHADIKHFL